MSDQLTPSAERHLYDTDKPAWHRYVAPRMAEVLANTNDTAIGVAWECMARGYQTAVWPLLDDATRQRIRAARDHADLEHAA